VTIVFTNKKRKVNLYFGEKSFHEINMGEVVHLKKKDKMSQKG
jgi:hypothetical protein